MRRPHLPIRGLFAALVPAFALVAATAAYAQGAPAQLRGKSIILNWTENRMQRGEGETDFRPVNSNQTVQVYVSTEGRVFERRSSVVARRGKRPPQSGSRENVGGGTVAGRSSSSTQFRGRSLVLVGAMRQGGRLVTAEFDAGFSSCTLQVSIGRQAGTDLMKGTSMTTGRRIEYQSFGVSGTSCSLRDGNVFGQ